jgi:hypothetical protein
MCCQPGRFWQQLTGACVAHPPPAIGWPRHTLVDQVRLVDMYARYQCPEQEARVDAGCGMRCRSMCCLMTLSYVIANTAECNIS